MSLIELVFNYAWECYHYGRQQANQSLVEMGVDRIVAASIKGSVDDDGNFVSVDSDNPIFFPYSYKEDLYRPNDSIKPTKNTVRKVITDRSLN